MSSICRFILLTVFLLLIGCATQSENISLSQNDRHHLNKNIAVVITEPPKPVFINGDSDGLLADAITSSSMQQLTTSLEKIDPEKYKQFARKISNKLPKHSKTHPELNAIFTIKINAIGVKRYYAFIIPNTPPSAYFSITGELINLADKKILWRYSVSIAEPVKNDWDQPPSYSNLKIAFYKAMETAEKELLKNLVLIH